MKLTAQKPITLTFHTSRIHKYSLQKEKETVLSVCYVLNPVAANKSVTLHPVPSESQSLSTSWARLSLHLPDNHTRNPSVDCQLSSVTWADSTV